MNLSQTMGLGSHTHSFQGDPPSPCTGSYMTTVSMFTIHIRSFTWCHMATVSLVNPFIDPIPHVHSLQGEHSPRLCTWVHTSTVSTVTPPPRHFTWLYTSTGSRVSFYPRHCILGHVSTFFREKTPHRTCTWGHMSTESPLLRTCTWY